MVFLEAFWNYSISIKEKRGLQEEEGKSDDPDVGYNLNKYSDMYIIPNIRNETVGFLGGFFWTQTHECLGF